MELLKFPDELILLILQKVRTIDLFACRLVCSRLGALALHPSVWRHRRLGNRSPYTCPILRLAPCLAKLVVVLPTSSNCHPLTLFSTRCAASSLEMIVGPGGAAQGALIIKNQEALGRLSCLDVELEDDYENEVEVRGDEASVFLGAVASTSGLEKLVVRSVPACGPSMNCYLEHADVSVSVPCIKRLNFNVSLLGESLLTHVVSGNHATLTTVKLTGFDSFTGISEMAALAPLLATLPALRVLTCPLLPGLEAVAACEALERVYLQLSPGTPAAARSAVEFLLRAKALRHVSLDGNDFGTPHSVCCELIGALSAGSSRSSVSSMSMVFLPWTQAMPAVVQRSLLTALPLLPALRTVLVSAIPQELLMGIKPATAPSLKSLLLDLWQFPSCAHSLLHGEPVKAFLAANPSLRLLVPRTLSSYCTGAGTACDDCARGCHQSLPHQIDQRFTSKFVPLSRGVPQ